MPTLGLRVKYQYNFSNYFRLEPSFTYSVIQEADGYNWAGLVNVDFFFIRPHRFRPYAFAGIGLASFRAYETKKVGMYWSDITESTVAFAVDAGLGLDWRLSHHISLQGEGGLLASVKGSNPGFFFLIGVSYNF